MNKITNRWKALHFRKTQGLTESWWLNHHVNIINRKERLSVGSKTLNLSVLLRELNMKHWPQQIFWHEKYYKENKRFIRNASMYLMPHMRVMDLILWKELKKTKLPLQVVLFHQIEWKKTKTLSFLIIWKMEQLSPNMLH